MKCILQWAPRGLALLLLAGVLGCPFSPETNDDPPPVPVETYHARTAPESLLHNLKLAYKERVPAEYESLLAEEFSFVLSEEDASKPDMPDQWGRNQEISIHQAMFNAELVQQLTLDFVVGNREYDDTDGFWTILISNVTLTLYGSTPGHPTPTWYRVVNGASRFWFQKENYTWPGTQDTVWTIVKWEDNPIDN